MSTKFLPPAVVQTVRYFLRYVRTLMHRDFWWAEFLISGIGALGWSMIAFLAPFDTLDRPAMELLERIGSDNFWIAWLGTFALIHLAGLFLNVNSVRVVASFALCWAFSTIFWAVAYMQPWSNGLALYAAVVGVYCSALANQAYHFMVDRVERRRVFLNGRQTN